MTRTEFIEDINDFSSLVEFCNTWGYDELEVYSSDEVDGMIDDEIRDCLEWNTWQNVRNDLNTIDLDYDWLYREGPLEYSGLYGRDLGRYKALVLDWGDERDIWDEEEPEDVEFVPPEESECVPPEEEAPQEEFSVQDLISLCRSDLSEFAAEAADRAGAEQASDWAALNALFA